MAGQRLLSWLDKMTFGIENGRKEKILRTSRFLEMISTDKSSFVGDSFTCPSSKEMKIFTTRFNFVEKQFSGYLIINLKFLLFIQKLEFFKVYCFREAFNFFFIYCGQATLLRISKKLLIEIQR